MQLGIFRLEGRALLLVGSVAARLFFLSAEFVELLVIDGLLALQQLKSHVGGSEVAADADEVGITGSVAIDCLARLCLSDAGDADGQSGIRRGGLASYDVYAPFVAGLSQSAIEQFHVFDGEALAECYADNHLPRCAVHGKDVGNVDHCRLVAQQFYADIGKVEVHALHEHVGSDEHLAVGVGENGAVVAHALLCAGVLWLDVFCQVLDESELTQLGNVCHLYNFYL